MISVWKDSFGGEFIGFDDFIELNQYEGRDKTMRCKMVLSFKDQTNHQLFFNVVYDGSEENKQFFKFTPGGMIQLNVVNDAVFEKMEQGKEYYIDFSQTF